MNSPNGTPLAIITDKAVLQSREDGEAYVDTLHSGITKPEIRETTSWDVAFKEEATVTTPPSVNEITLIKKTRPKWYLYLRQGMYYLGAILGAGHNDCFDFCVVGLKDLFAEAYGEFVVSIVRRSNLSNAHAGCTRLRICDGETIEPVAVAMLPIAESFGFHGRWFPRGTFAHEQRSHA